MYLRVMGCGLAYGGGFDGESRPIIKMSLCVKVFKGPRGMVSAWVYPVNWHRGWMGVKRSRGLAETSRLPGARIKFRVTIAS